MIPQPNEESLFLSAKENINIDALMELIEKKIFSDRVRACLLIPFSRGDLSSYLCEQASVEVMDYRQEGTYFEVVLKNSDYQRLKEYEVV